MSDTTDPTPEDQATEAEAPAVLDEAQAGVAPTAEADTETEATAEDESVLPADYETLADDDLTSLFNDLEGRIAEIKALPETEVTAQSVAEAKSIRQAQATISQLLQTRIDERVKNAQELAALDENVPSLPEAPVSQPPAEAPKAKAAAAQPVSAAPVSVTPAEAVAERDTVTNVDPATPSGRRALTAAVASTQSRWLNARDNDAASWIDLVNNTRPAKGGRDGIEARPKESILAAARSVDSSYDDMLTDSPSHNERAIAEAMERHRDERMSAGHGAHLAAICDPATIIRDAMVIGTDATPFQSSLVQMTATSGNALKFQYRLPTSITEAENGVGEWDVTAQDAIDPTDPDTWKPCVPIGCPGYDTQSATEITACYEIDAFTELSSPEAEADFVFAKDRAFARYTEAWHLRKTDTFLRYVSFNGYTGAVPSVVEAVLTSITAGDYGERLEAGSYTIYGSPGLLYALAVDANTRAFGDIGESLNDVRQAVLDATGCSYVQLLDRELDSGGSLKASPFGSFGAVGAASPTVMPRLSTVGFTLRILDPSSIVAFNTGEAVFGEQITLDQARQNKRGFFQRIFGGQMKPGITPGYKVDITLCTDGSRGGFVAPGCPPSGFDASGAGFVATPQG